MATETLLFRFSDGQELIIKPGKLKQKKPANNHPWLIHCGGGNWEVLLSLSLNFLKDCLPHEHETFEEELKKPNNKEREKRDREVEVFSVSPDK